MNQKAKCADAQQTQTVLDANGSSSEPEDARRQNIVVDVQANGL